MSVMTNNLSTGYSAQIDAMNEDDWASLVVQFRDATVNQTWSFGERLSGKGSLSHLVLKRDGEVAAAAQVRIETLPVIRAGIAYVGWGPLWRRWDREDNPDDYREIVRLLHEEYAVKRGLFLTVVPDAWEGDAHAQTMGSILSTEGFAWKESPHRTLLLDLDPSLDALRAQLRSRWRNYLKRVEREGFHIREGKGDDLFEQFKRIYKEMYARKQYPADVNIDTYAAIQRELPEALKPRIVLCESEGEIMAGGVFSTIGETGLYMLGATSDRGMKSRASYLLHWRMVQWLKENGFRRYDLGGADPENTPGTYQFKAGLCGKSSTIVRRIGEFVSCESAVSSSVVKCGYIGRRSAQWLKSKIKVSS